MLVWVRWIEIAEWVVGDGKTYGKKRREVKEQKGKKKSLTARRHIGQMHSSLMAQLGQQQRSDNIAAHRLNPVVFAPVDVWPSGFAGAVDDSSWPEVVEDLTHARLVFHADVGGVYSFALGLEQAFEVAADPALAAGEEEAVFLVHA